MKETILSKVQIGSIVKRGPSRHANSGCREKMGHGLKHLFCLSSFYFPNKITLLKAGLSISRSELTWLVPNAVSKRYILCCIGNFSNNTLTNYFNFNTAVRL